MNIQKKNIPKLKDPFKNLKGCMNHLKGKYTSVELQHEAMKLWIKKFNSQEKKYKKKSH